MNPDNLDNKLIHAHDEGNLSELVGLYTKAGDASEQAGDIDAACFYLTHAYIFALEAGNERADEIHQRLSVYGRNPA